jgi:hypothetical protein
MPSLMATEPPTILPACLLLCLAGRLAARHAYMLHYSLFMVNHRTVTDF